MHDLSKKVKYVFTNLDLSQAKIAKRLGITEAYVSKLLNPKEKINISKTLSKLICHEFNLNQEWFYGENDEPMQVAEHKPEYNQHGNWQPVRELLSSEEWKLIGKAHEIITSDTAYSAALVSNINAFYQAIQETKKTNAVQKECADLKARIEAIEKGHTEDPTNENIEKKAM